MQQTPTRNSPQGGLKGDPSSPAFPYVSPVTEPARRRGLCDQNGEVRVGSQAD